MSRSRRRLFAFVLCAGCATASTDNKSPPAPVTSPALAQARAAAQTPAVAAAAPAPTGGAAVKVTTVEGITEYRLANGLQVLLFPDQSKPTVTVNITYFVGSRHEGYGETGHGAPARAHAVQGHAHATPTSGSCCRTAAPSSTAPPGTTAPTTTRSCRPRPRTSSSPSALEADRMVNSRIAAEDLAKEFSVVRNEFEMGENNPAGVLEERMFAAAYQWHNYGKTTIGSRSDIERVPVDNLRAFYRSFYQPDNAMLVVAGKFDEAKALELVAAHLRRRSRARRASCSRDLHRGAGAGRRAHGDAAAHRRRGGGRRRCTTAVAGADPDWLAFDAAGRRADQQAGRAPVQGAGGEGAGQRGVRLRLPHRRAGGAVRRRQGAARAARPEKVRDALIKVVEELARRPVTDDEVERWRARSLKEFELALTDTAAGRAWRCRTGRRWATGGCSSSPATG